MKTSRLAISLGLAAALGAVAAFSLAEGPRGGFPADPPGIATKKQWIFDVTYKDGKASVTRVSSSFFNNPTATARMMGRFAVEFWVGKELIDRIRFEVPLLDDPSMHRKGPLAGPRFGQVSTHLKVRMADSSRAAYVAVVDRGTGDVQRFAWPPEPDGRLVPLNAPPAAAPDAGVPADAGASDGGRGPDAAPRDASADGS